LTTAARCSGATRRAQVPGCQSPRASSRSVLAWLTISHRGRSLIERWRSRRAKPAADKKPSWAERHLSRANVPVATGVGAAINLPGPFYLLALGDIAVGAYTNAEELALILIFNATMFLLLEVPLVGYVEIRQAVGGRRINS
jgi:hypothetical protein